MHKLRLDPQFANEEGARDFAAVDGAWMGREGGRDGGCEYFVKVARNLSPSLVPLL
jgi:hypothetical protein